MTARVFAAGYFLMIAVTGPVAAENTSGPGAICIAPFYAPRDFGPDMSQTTR